MNFNGKRLRVLRHYHEFTQRSLGAAVGATASTITKWEGGSAEPRGIGVDALGVVLRVAPEFFYQPVDEFLDPQTNFRSRLTTSERKRKKILGHASLFAATLDYMGSHVVWPALRLPSIPARGYAEIERAAEALREQVGVGVDTPILNVTHLAELCGIVVTTLEGSVSGKIDAFSRYGQTNVIVLNPARGSASRTRFDIGHEIAHGVLGHSDATTLTERETEDHAERFAGAFMLPAKAFGREFWALGKNSTWSQLIRLKERWGVHLPAMIVRAYQLGLIDAAEYARRFKYMAKYGWLRVGGAPEPGEPAAEPPQLFKLGVQTFRRETGKDGRAMASDLHMTAALFYEVTGFEADVSDPPIDNVASFEAFRQRKTATG